MPFNFLMLFTVVLFLRPHELYPPLSIVPIAKIIALAAIVSFFTSKNKEIPELFKTNEVKLLMALAAVIIITSPFGLWPGGSFHKFTNDFIQVVLILLLIAGVVDSPEKVTKLLWLMILSTFTVALLGIYDSSRGTTFTANRLYSRVGLYGDPNDFAVTLAAMIPFAIYLFKVHPSFRKRVILITILVLYIINIILTYSRTGMIAMGVIAIGLTVKSRRKAKTLILILIILGLIICLAPSRYKDRAASIFIPEKSEDGSREARITIFWRGIEIFLENPVLGVGLGNFSVAEGAMHEFGQWKVAHNGYLEMASELGIFGLIIFLGLLYLTIENFRQIQKISSAPNHSIASLYLFQMLEVSLWVYMVSNFFLSTQYSWTLFYLMGFSVASKLNDGNFGTLKT